MVLSLEKPDVVNHTRGTEADVGVGDADPEETHPRPQHVAAVEAAHRVVAARAGRGLRLRIEETADEMAQRMTPERVAAEENDVDDEHERTNRKAEVLSVRTREPKRIPRIAAEDEDEGERE